MKFLDRFAKRRRSLVVCLAAGVLLGCNMSVRQADPPTSSGGTGPGYAQDWQAIAPGVERREMDLPTASISLRGTMSVLRVDPALATFRVHYSPGAAYSLPDWASRLPGALAIVNGAFFDEFDCALGLLVSEGQVFGSSFAGFGGMFQVGSSGVRVRSLVGEPYQGEPLWQAVQAFPMLIEQGGQLAPQGAGFDARSRRTWIGQDRWGRIVIGVTFNLISLADLQNWLLASGLDLNTAFGLDGGRSAGLLVAAPNAGQSLLSVDALPSVIAVYGS